MKKMVIMMTAVIAMTMTFAAPRSSIAEMSGEIAECVYEIVESED